MVGESWPAKRMRALNMIVRSMQEIDEYNLKGKDAKEIDHDKFLTEICFEFEIKRQTAAEWFDEALKMYEWQHNANMSQERYMRDKNE